MSCVDCDKLNSLLRQREEALELVMATCDNKDWYMARQGESFEAMRHHGITLEAQLAAMNAEAEEVSGEALQRCLSLEQQLAAMTAERDAFIQGGVTEDLLRKCDGFIKVGRGCVLVRDDDYAQLTQQFAASQARCAQLVDALGDIAPFAASWLEETYDDEYTKHSSWIKVKQALTPTEGPPVIDIQRFERAPCYLCGYGGGGYYQPDTHPCAKKYHQATERPPA